MPAATEVQAATLQRFIKGWGEWTPDFLSSWSDDLAFTPLPFSMGKPTRPRETLEPLYLRLISTLKNYQLTVHNVVHDSAQGKAAIYATVKADTSFEPYVNAQAVFISFDESGEMVNKIEEMNDTAFQKDWDPKYHEHVQASETISSPSVTEDWESDAKAPKPKFRMKSFGLCFALLCYSKSPPFPWPPSELHTLSFAFPQRYPGPQMIHTPLFYVVAKEQPVRQSSRASPSEATATMAHAKSNPLGVQASAIITGSFLSGAMMGLSLTTIPLFLDTNTQSAHMLTQWVRLYHYGHLLLPSMAIATFLVYAYMVTAKWASGNKWVTCAAAGVVTVSMIPFTLIVMAPTNSTLFRLEKEIKVEAAVATLDQVQALVTRWGRMHFVRSLFPLVGAVLGFSGLMDELTAE